MSKRRDRQTSKSAYADLIRIHEQGGEAGQPVPTGTPESSPRKRGKSADPEYVKLTSYIRRQTHLAVKKKLLDQGREISELVEELLDKWLVEPLQ